MIVPELLLEVCHDFMLLLWRLSCCCVDDGIDTADFNFVLLVKYYVLFWYLRIYFFVILISLLVHDA